MRISLIQIPIQVKPACKWGYSLFSQEEGLVNFALWFVNINHYFLVVLTTSDALVSA